MDTPRSFSSPPRDHLAHDLMPLPEEMELGWPRGLLPGAPTDPDVPNSGIRLFVTRLRYVGAQ